LRLLSNPIFLKAAAGLFFAMLAFLIGVIFARQLRKQIADEADLSPKSPLSAGAMPLHIYNTVIQQLKQQKHELQVQSQAEQQRARTSETLSQAVLSNLPCGVLLFGDNGLIRTSNPAAREILGFASVSGMNAQGIFREALVADSALRDESVAPVRLADEVDTVLREGIERRQVEAEYETPANQTRYISVTVSRVLAGDGLAGDRELLGVACLINDLSQIATIRRQQALHGEISAEMALQLRTSLATISGYAQQLANSRDAELARQLAEDIAGLSAQLDRSIGGFLTSRDHRESADRIQFAD
jgi:nitrogen fixation/metabolism regulation signal transduction histidine kinase